MPSAGRNDPCPCGSGKKFKKCCLLEPAALSPAADVSAREGALSKLLRFAERPQFDSDREIGNILFWGKRLFEIPAPDAQALLEGDDAAAKYNCWFVFDLDIEGGRTIADMFLAQKSHQLSAAEHGFLDRLRQSHLALYEAIGVTPGRGIELRDLWTGAEMFVEERTASRSLVVWDLLGGRVVAGSDGVARFEGGMYLYNRGDKDTILQELKRYHRRFVKHNPHADLPDFFRRHGMIFNHLWLDLVVCRPLPKIVTAEGDQLVFTRVAFDVDDAAAFPVLLADRDDVDPQGDGTFVWTEEAPPGYRTLGTITIRGARLLLETVSKERAVRGREWLEALAGSTIRYRATSYETLASAIEHRRSEPAPPPGDDPSPEMAAGAVQELQDLHYRAWLDQPIPALGDHAPRAAARSKRWRPRLVDLLKQTENQAERNRLAGRPAYDSSWLWRELGLSRD